MTSLRHRMLKVGAGAIVALVLLPTLGLVAFYFDPPSLFAPPPLGIERLWPPVLRSLGLAAAVSALSAALGTWLAWLEQRCAYPGRRLLSLLSVLPLAVPSYLLATILRESFAPRGFFGALLGRETPFAGFWPAVCVLALTCTPYVQLLVGAALARFPVAEDEAARSLGAGPWRRFRQLVVPRLRPTWAFALMVVGFYVISDFGAVAVVDCRVLTFELYNAKGARDAVVIGAAILALVVPALVGLRLLHGRRTNLSSLSGERGGERLVLGPVARCAAWLTHGLVIGFGVLLPVVLLGRWVAGGLAHAAAFAPIGAPLLNSLVIAVGGALLTVLLAIVPAWSVTRGGGRAWQEHGTYLTSSLPGILVAVGLLQLTLALKRYARAGTGLWESLEQAGTFLFIGLAMRFVAEAYAALKPALLRLDPRTDEAARNLGAGPWRRLLRVNLPLLAPGLGAAGLLVFLAVAKELPITLLLTPRGHPTLAFRIFDAQQEGSLPDVGLAGLLLLGLVLAMQLALMRWRRADG